MGRNKYRQIWNLDSIFQSLKKSNQFSNHILDIEQGLAKLDGDIAVTSISSVEDADHILNILMEIDSIKLKLSQASSFITCLLAQNPSDQEASVFQGRVTKLKSKYGVILTNFQAILASTSLEIWIDVLKSEELKDFTFILAEWREEGKTTLTSNEKAILSKLSIDGYHAWGQLYQTLMGNLEIEIQLEGKPQKYSIGQALNLRAHSNEELRKAAHEKLELKWSEQKETFAKVLNHIAGFRLQLYNFQGIDDVLEEPLRKNRMKKQTLEAMWSVVSKNKNAFAEYLYRKGKMTGEEKMQSYNFWANFETNSQKIHYDDAIDLVKGFFRKFGKQLEAFVTTAIEGGWIEAENRPKKSAAAFCAGFPMSEESRIFMTFDETMKSILTLAHELGHAFHNTAMNGISSLNRQYPLCIAETASFFAELIVLDAAIEAAESKSEKITLVDEKLKRSVMNFMNIHSRFLFEQNFYEERKKGLVSTQRLNELMQEAILDGYRDSLDNVSVYTWLWTPHFYITDAPFYNFPYTFGYLLTYSLYEKAKEIGPEFENIYIQLLRDSGKMPIEELILKHLNEDITKEDFWEKGMKLCVQDVDLFLELTALERV
ncbi:M3 family oligoendopeptidase [Solibacillus daqui]|uniref:M3 family oligoendopeptidase n=1 Tax=Solibacillus daqui TaxID=2912187 RepID=UPI002365E9A9|nr:M3 family oligoendopeptidase [Solibacillus daqui]